MSNDCSNQLVANTDQELDSLNNDDPIPLINTLIALCPLRTLRIWKMLKVNIMILLV